MEIKDKYSEMIILKRMEIYPELQKITQDIGKDNLEDQKEIRRIHQDAFDKLKQWQEKYTTNFMSKETYVVFKDLQHVLNFKKLPEEKNLDEVKIKSIWAKREKLRDLANKDLETLRNSEISLREKIS